MKNTLYNALKDIIFNLDYPETDVLIQLPKNPAHGDFTTNLAMQLGRPANPPPPPITHAITRSRFVLFFTPKVFNTLSATMSPIAWTTDGLS